MKKCYSHIEKAESVAQALHQISTQSFYTQSSAQTLGKQLLNWTKQMPSCHKNNCARRLTENRQTVRQIPEDEVPSEEYVFIENRRCEGERHQDIVE